MDIRLDSLAETRLIEGVDAYGRITDDPTVAVEGVIELVYLDGKRDRVVFDRVHALPPARVSA